MLLQAHFPSLLPKQSARSHHDQAVNELGRELPTEQSGFRKHHSTNDKLFELTQAVCQAQ